RPLCVRVREHPRLQRRAGDRPPRCDGIRLREPARGPRARHCRPAHPGGEAAVTTAIGGEAEVYAELQAEPRRAGSPTGRMLRRLLRKKLAVACLVVIAIFYAAGIFAPLLAPHGYSDQNLDLSFSGPSLDHPFGTDRLGRDMLSRNMYAARTTVIVTLATV